MAENKINVTVSANTKKNITVTSSQVSTEITASTDTGRFWAQTAKNWAVADVIVDNTDYSSKYYANKAKESASSSQSNADVCNNIYNSVQEVSQTVFDNIGTKSEEAITNINNAKTDAENSINNVKTEAENIINNTKTTAINDLEFVADGEKQEIEEIAENAKDDIKSTGFYMQDDKLYFINSKGEEQEFKSGGGGLEIGDIGFTQMAIDETKGKRRAINKLNNIIIQEQYPELTKKIKRTRDLHPEYFCTESEWQAEVTMSTASVCYKYVIDDEAGTIRLPKYPEYFDIGVDGTKTVDVYGNGMALGLTSGSKNYNLMRNYSGGINGLNTGTSAIGKILPVTSNEADLTTDNASLGIIKDASTSGLTGSVTTESEQIKGTYFIQVATGAETEDNIINEIELNNPYSLGDSKYSPVALNNLSWLKSEGQYNAKAVYPAYYEWLLKIYNGVEVVDGISVKLSTEEYTDYDFVLNTAEETFKLPLLDGSESLLSDRYEDLTLEASGTTYTAPANGWFVVSKKGTADNQYLTMYGNNVYSKLFSATTGSVEINLPVAKGTIVTVSYNVAGDTNFFRFVYAKGNGSLYFYVGETVQNANLINAGRIEEKLIDKVDVNSSWGFPSNRYIDLTLGASGTTYTAPANGWYVLRKQFTANTQHVALINQNNGLQQYNHTSSSTSGSLGVHIPVKKGDVVEARWSAGGNLDIFRFIYAEGEQ